MTANDQRPIEHVAVFGAGLVALSAAVAIARTAPRAQVLMVGTPPEPAALADRIAASLPASGAMFERLGLPEEGLIAGGAAVHKLGEQFSDWGDAHGWTQGFGTAAPIGLAGAPHQLWLASNPGRGKVLSDQYPASVLVEARRFAEAADERSLLAQVHPALRLDPARVVPILWELARRNGVVRRNGAVIAVERTEKGMCAAVVISGGERVTADLYVDATGPAAPVATAMGASRIDWTAWLPVDRLLLTEKSSPPDLADRYVAVDLGWRAAWPLRDRTVVGLAYCNEGGSETRARRVLGDASGAAERIAVQPGRLAAAWTGNVLALGDGACATGPLGASGLALAHLHLATLLELWPAAAPDQLLVAEYNRRVALASDRLRDWLAAAYLLHPRRTGELWRRSRNSELPESLARTVAQFAQRALVPHGEEDPFSRDDWAQRLVGLGLRPRRLDPVALSADPAALTAALAQAAAATSKLAGALPRYPAYLASLATRRQA